MNMSMEILMCSPFNATGLRYTRPLLEIEKNFDLCRAYTWHTVNWLLCFPFIGAYLVAIFAGREFMKSRPPFQLRGALLIWNITLATFSAVGSWRMLTAVEYSVRNYGFSTTLCKMHCIEQRQALGVWVFLYILSKILEFGDTAFIVLRKSPLIFLHWYHHVTVAFFVWSSGAYASPMQIFYCTFNYAVHSIMYSYYALKVLEIHVPKVVSMAITSLQLVQMVAGIYVTGYAHLAKSVDPTCFVPVEAIAIAASIYVSYSMLFLNFFIKTYFGKRTPERTRNGYSKKTM